jgi:hypothetical protein
LTHPEDGFSDMTFTNTFVNTTDGGVENPDPKSNAALTVSNTLAGDGSAADINSYTAFTYNIKITLPTIAKAQEGGYRAYVLNIGNTPVTIASGKGGTDPTYGDYYLFTSGEDKGIPLLHNQRLVFVDTPVGTEWTATVKLTNSSPYAKYIASAEVFENNVHTGVTLTKNTSGIALPLADFGTWLIGETIAPNGNKAAFTNSTEAPTPGGIIMNNLPYVGLIALAFLGLAAYIALRTRRRSAAEYGTDAAV